MSAESDVVQVKKEVADLKKEVARWQTQLVLSDELVSHTMMDYVKRQLASIITRIERLERH